MKKKSNLNVFTYCYNPGKYIRNWPHNILSFFRNCKRAWDRATKGFCDRDTWDMDYFYAELFADSLKYFAENSLGYPSALEKLNKPDAKDGEESEGGKEWKRLLLEASENFRNYNLDDNEETIKTWDAYLKIKEEEYNKREDKNKKTISILLPDDTPECKEAKAKWMKADIDLDEFRQYSLNKGFDFFKDWFRNLWD